MRSPLAERSNEDMDEYNDDPLPAQAGAPHGRSREGADGRVQTPPHMFEGKEESKLDDVPTSSFLRLHAVIDVLDTHDVWCEARIEEMDAHRGRVFVHYIFWTSQWDAWIPMSSHRLAPLGSHTFQRPPGVLRLHARVDVYDPHPSQMRFQEGVVVALREDAALVHFIKFHARYDEWIPLHSERFQPYGHHTRTRQPYRPRAATYWASRPREMAFAQQGDPRMAAYLGALATAGMHVERMGGDGNCLFRSVAHQVYGDQELHGLCRAAAVEYMTCESAWFSNFVVGEASGFEQYIDEMRRQGTWGDDPEIQALCEVYDRSAVIYAYDAEHGARRLRVFRSERADARPPIVLSYYGGGHYDSIVGRDFAANLARSTPGVVEERAISLARVRIAGGAHADAAEAAAMGAAIAASREVYDAADQNLDAALLVSLGMEAGAAMRVAESSAAAGGRDLDQTVLQSVLEETGTAAATEDMIANLHAVDEDAQLQAALAASTAAAPHAALSEDAQLREVLRMSAAAAPAAVDDDMDVAIAMSLNAPASHSMTAADELYNAALEMSEEQQIAMLLSGDMHRPAAAAAVAASRGAGSQAAGQPIPPTTQPQVPAAVARSADVDMGDDDAAMLAAAIAASLEA